MTPGKWAAHRVAAGSCFDFSSGGNDSLSCTADQGIGAECRAERMRERLGLIGMLDGDEQEGDVDA
jgi:hypothetical protein